MNCRHCGAQNTDEARFCEACGKSLAPQSRTCGACGAVNIEAAKFCVACGQSLDAPVTPPAPGAVPSAVTWFDRYKVAVVGVVVLAILLLALLVWLNPGSSGESRSTATKTTGSDAATLGALVGVLALGGAFSTSILLERPRTRFPAAAIIGLVAGLSYKSVPDRLSSGNTWGDLAIAIAASCAMAAAGTAFFRRWTFVLDAPKQRRWLRNVLIPHNWHKVAVSGPQSPKEFAARWYVTIAASTGSVVGALMTQPEFWHATLATLAPSRIIFAVLLALVSITLIGPMEEYLLGQRITPDADEGETESAARAVIEDIWENFSPRAAGRVAMVFLFCFQLVLVNSCVGETMSKGDPGATFVIISAAIFPAFITYYWSAALQRGSRSVTLQAGWSSTVLSAVVCYPVSVSVIVWVGGNALMQWANQPAALIVILPLDLVLGEIMALVFGFILCGVQAYAGGWAIDYARRRSEIDGWKAVTMLGGMLVAANLLMIVGALAMVQALAPAAKIDWTTALLGAMSNVGWTVGLVLSGFPKILQRARNRPPSPQTASPAVPLPAA